jgi:uncharacterized membrane protein YcgQ (UPF0703/DUF1980 family)
MKNFFIFKFTLKIELKKWIKFYIAAGFTALVLASVCCLLLLLDKYFPRRCYNSATTSISFETSGTKKLVHDIFLVVSGWGYDSIGRVYALQA